MRHLDLFSGIGGFALACQWVGMETIGFVEIDKYCQKVLRKHWPDVPIVEDIRDVEKIKEIVANAQQERCLQRTDRGKTKYPRHRQGLSEGRGQIITYSPCKGLEGGESQSELQRPKQSARCNRRNRAEVINPTKSPAILITAGFPCQPFSVAGKQLSQGDDRYLWPETLAVIEAIKPKWVLLENVTGIINLALDTVLSNLEGAGYSWETLIIPACAVNAWHRRDRIWIVAWHSESNGSYQERSLQERQTTVARGVCSDVPNTQRGQIGDRLSFGRIADQRRGATEARGETLCPGQEASQPSDIGQSSQDVAKSKSRESRQQTEQEGGEDTSRGSQEVAIADPTSNGSEAGISGQEQGQEGESRKPINNSEVDSNTEQQRRQGQGRGNGLRENCGQEETGRCNWWAVEPELGRVAYGIPHRVDRLKCLGNAVVPQVAYEIIKVISMNEEING